MPVNEEQLRSEDRCPGTSPENGETEAPEAEWNYFAVRVVGLAKALKLRECYYFLGGPDGVRRLEPGECVPQHPSLEDRKSKPDSSA